MLQSILDLATRVLDLFAARSKQIEEWTRARLDALRSETARSDSADAHGDYADLEDRARGGEHDGNRRPVDPS